MFALRPEQRFLATKKWYLLWPLGFAGACFEFRELWHLLSLNYMFIAVTHCGWVEE